ncbi:MAG: helix-turn-helix transcriptional regulator [Negativicutes bacterium]
MVKIMGFSENIKRVREAHKMNQSEMAKIAGVTFQAVSSWENEGKQPRMETVEKICEHFNLKKSHLFDDNLDIKRVREEADAIELARAILRMPPVKRNAYISLIKAEENSAEKAI